MFMSVLFADKLTMLVWRN